MQSGSDLSVATGIVPITLSDGANTDTPNTDLIPPGTYVFEWACDKPLTIAATGNRSVKIFLMTNSPLMPEAGATSVDERTPLFPSRRGRSESHTQGGFVRLDDDDGGEEPEQLVKGGQAYFVKHLDRHGKTYELYEGSGEGDDDTEDPGMKCMELAHEGIEESLPSH